MWNYEKLDREDVLAHYNSKFLFPKNCTTRKTIYMCANSLGLQPQGLNHCLNKQLEKWANEAVEGHFSGETPWVDIDDIVAGSMASLVGANKSEVVMMNSLTCNLHLMMLSFYRPSKNRFKILIEKYAFPSDYHVVLSHIQLAGYDPVDALIEMSPRINEVCIRQEDIDHLLAVEGHSIDVVLFSGVQYYTGQLFDMAKITSNAKAQGCKVGFDLAHAVGNVPLRLHDWGCDFACWCTYKYLNCGPGSIGGCFIHKKYDQEKETSSPLLHCNNDSIHVSKASPSTISSNSTSNEELTTTTTTIPLRRFAGWWGHRREDRFEMASHFIPCNGANGFRLSNPSVLLIACVRASLDIFDEVGIDRLRAKSVKLTGYLETLLLQIQSELVQFATAEQSSNMQHSCSATYHYYSLDILTPANQAQRGCQLSIAIKLNENSVDNAPLPSPLLEGSLSDNGNSHEMIYRDFSVPVVATSSLTACDSMCTKTSSPNIPTTTTSGSGDDSPESIANCIVRKLRTEGVICDARQPNVLRVAPAPLYNSFRDVYDFASILKKTLFTLQYQINSTQNSC